MLMALVTALVAGWVGGCATLGEHEGVSLSVVDLLPTQASLFETSASLKLRFTNESTQPLVLSGGSHRLYLNGSYVGRAVSSERLTIPALGTNTQTVVVHLENLTLFRKAAELSNSTAPAIGYRLESRLHSAKGSTFGRLQVTSSGELDLSGLTRSPARDVTSRPAASNAPRAAAPRP